MTEREHCYPPLAPERAGGDLVRVPADGGPSEDRSADSRSVTPNPKPFTKRRRASANEWLQIRDKFPELTCRLCSEVWEDLHHLLPKDGNGTWPSGDDLASNLVPLCRFHHVQVELRHRSTRSRVRATLTDRNVEYLKGRIGDRWHVFLDRHYAEAA